MRSDFLTQGPVVPAFESAVVTYCQARQGVAVSNATAELHLACLELGLDKGDLMWNNLITFVASANCVLYCGAEVDFVGIDARSFNLCPIVLEKKLEIAKQKGRLLKIVIPVQMCGQSCDMQAIYTLSQKYGFKIIEETSHAIGAATKANLSTIVAPKYLTNLIGERVNQDINKNSPIFRSLKKYNLNHYIYF